MILDPESTIPAPPKAEGCPLNGAFHIWSFGSTMALTVPNRLSGLNQTILTVVLVCQCGAIAHKRLPEPA